MYLFSQNQNATGTYEKMAAEKVGPEYLSLIAPKKLEIVFWNQLYYFALGIKKKIIGLVLVVFQRSVVHMWGHNLLSSSSEHCNLHLMAP